MNRPSWKSLVFGMVVVAALFTVVGQVNAGWWHGGCCGVYGPFPYYTAWDSCCGGGDWYYGYRPWRGGCRTRCGWYSACYYPTYSCCGGYSTWGVTSGCCGDTVYGTGTLSVPGMVTAPGQPTPAAKKPVIPAPNPPTPDTTTPAPGTATPDVPGPTVTPNIENPTPGVPTTIVTPDSSGILTVWVPADAKVIINGMATKSTGSRRQFVSYDLKSGFSYKYEVRAEVVRDGKIVEDTKTVVLTAGANAGLAFGFNIVPTEGLVAQ